MNRKNNMWKAVIAIAVALAFVLPGSAVFAYDKELMNNSEIIVEIDSAGLYPFSYRNEKSGDTSIFPTPDASNLGVLGDTFYGYICYDSGGVLPNGPVSFQSDNPGIITLLKATVSSSFISGGTWAEGTWYACQYDNGWLWTIDEVTGNMTLIGGGGASLNGLAYDPITGKMYGAGSYDLYVINMSNGGQTYVGPFNNGGVIVGIAFDGGGNLYGEDIGTDSLYSINTLTGAATLIGPFGMNLGYAQDMAYDIDNNILYLAAFTGNGYLCTCNVATGALTIVGEFQRNAEIDGFAIPYTISQPPETPQRPNGPTEGIVDYNYTFSTSTTDPEGNQVYYKWNWSDGTFSNWLGPYDSGDVVLAHHTWMGAGTYEVRVKAKDIYSHESSWSDPKTIHIVNEATLEIGNITGGLFKVNAVIKNTGGVDALAVNWSITLDGGFILAGKETSGKITGISTGGEVAISSDFILGFGKTVITVSAETAGSSDTVEQDAFVLLFFIK
jgi:hypothetical protein